MDRRWTSHIQDPEEKKRFTAYLLGSRTALERLEEIILQMEIELETQDLAEERYDQPAWAERTADIIGQRRMLRKIVRLINLDPKEN